MNDRRYDWKPSGFQTLPSQPAGQFAEGAFQGALRSRCDINVDARVIKALVKQGTVSDGNTETNSFLRRYVTGGNVGADPGCKAGRVVCTESVQ